MPVRVLSERTVLVQNMTSWSYNEGEAGSDIVGHMWPSENYRVLLKATDAQILLKVREWREATELLNIEYDDGFTCLVLFLNDKTCPTGQEI